MQPKECINNLGFTPQEMKDPEIRNMHQEGYVKCGHIEDYLLGKLCSEKCKWYERRKIKHSFNIKSEA